jgi:hypothetical protein
MQSVGGDQVAGLDAGRGHTLAVLGEPGYPDRHDRNGELGGPGGERGVQCGAPHAQAVTVAEQCVGAAAGVQVADSAEGPPGRVDSDRRQPRHGARHQPLTARLVDRPGARLGHGDREAGLGTADRRGQPGRAAAHDQNVDHGTAAASACVSQRTRNVSSAAFRAVKVHAVMNAEPVSGSATPSITTAT